MRPVATCWGLGTGLLLGLTLSNVGWAGQPRSPAEGEAGAGAESGRTAEGEGGGTPDGRTPGATEESGTPSGAGAEAGPPDGSGDGEGERAPSPKPRGPRGEESAGAKGASASGEPGETSGSEATAAGATAPGTGRGAGAETTVDPTKSEEHQGGFEFGSYGRIIAATDGLGRAARNADIVAHGSRFDLSNYVELELRREDHWSAFDADSRIVVTLALGHPIFHWSGDFEGSLAVRNLYVEERDLGAKGLSVWAGSRMLRGDDIYLLDFWPLDNLNTVGGGLRYGVCGDSTEAPEGELPPPWCTAVSAHFGLGQPTNPFYKQEVDRPVPLNQFGAATVAILDRQRWVGSLRGEQILRFSERAGVKLVAYGELQGVPSAQREQPEQSEVYQDLPGDTGWALGGQAGLFTGEDDTHLNLFVRYASGLPAYGEFATPTSLALDRTASDAHELVVAMGGNWELGPVALTLGSYFRSFRNANGLLDFEDLDEGIILLRPHLFFVDWAGVALEGSYQLQQRGVVTTGLNDPVRDQDFEPLLGSVGRIGVMPFLTPAGPGAFKRPWIFLSYIASFRNEGARELYPETDPFRLHEIEHQVGIGAEWWFSSSSYGEK